MRELSKVMMFGLLILFVLVGTLLIHVGISGYEEVRTASKLQFEQRTPMGYIANKIRAHSNNDYPIEIREKEGQNILVLREGSYETWIYCLNNKLYEAYVSINSPLGLEFGFELMNLEQLDFKQTEDYLEVTLKPQNQKSQTLLFAKG